MNIWQQTALSLAAGLCFAHVSYAGTMSYRNTVLGDNPIIYYEFDETTGTTSSNIGSSGAANDGTIQGTMTLGVPSFAQGGTAYEFNRVNNSVGSYVQAAPLANSLSEWTLEAWVNWDDSLSHDFLGIYGNDQGGWNDDILFGIAPEGSVISPADELAIIHQGAPGTTRDMVVETLSTNTWHHVVATGSTINGELKLYINGLLVGTDNVLVNGITLNGADGIGTPATTVGATLSTTRYFDGLIDEFAIYGTALDAPTVANHYAAGIVPEPASLALLGLGGIVTMLRRRR